jgi:aerobic carbon-monoxide dehydrogenase medium subunit
MKLPYFDYACPATIEEALGLLAEDPENRKIIAGGQSLVPLLAFRVAQPGMLVDLQNLDELKEIAIDHDGIRLGALARWCDIENSIALKEAHPLLYSGCLNIAHFQIRNRGTVGGSLAHADPAAELPCIAVCCDAEIALKRQDGERVVPAGSFFLGPLETAIAPDEIITALRIPAWKPERKWGFEEFARRPGDLALAGISVFFEQDNDGHSCDSHIAAFGATSRPLRLTEAERQMDGAALNDAMIDKIARLAADLVDASADVHGSEAYRRGLIRTLTKRALQAARERK